jgi:NitT/TauT family transport system ATP-binding protein
MPIIISTCANIGRVIFAAVCQYSDMASRELVLSVVSGPAAELRAESDERHQLSANNIPMINRQGEATRSGLVAKRLVVDASNISLSFDTADGKVDALSNVSLQIADGEFVSFIGPSGCGKTTMLRVIADLQQPTSGNLLVNGMTAEQARLSRSYGYVFQAPALFPWRTIERNLKLPLEIMGYSETEQQQRVSRYLGLVNLTGFERKFPWQLSGGMQQRVSIARALSFDPDFLLMDEPFGALDEIVRDHLNEQLLHLWGTTGKTVLFVTHSIPEAVFLSTRIVVMSPRPGRIIDVIDCDFPRNRTLDIRETPEFLKVAHRVREGLRAGHAYDE